MHIIKMYVISQSLLELSVGNELFHVIFLLFPILPGKIGGLQDNDKNGCSEYGFPSKLFSKLM